VFVESASDLHSSLFEVLALPKMSLIASSFIRSVAIAFSLLIRFSCAYPNITRELGPLLSPGAAIVFPGSAQFLVDTDRDNEEYPPTFSVIVEVATESDVQETVSFSLRWIQAICSPQNRYDMLIATIYPSWLRLACMGEPSLWETCNRGSIST
jgi:hypothetical protein